MTVRGGRRNAEPPSVTPGTYHLRLDLPERAMRMPERTPISAKCPSCQSADVVPIMYGLALPDMGEAARRGEIVLSGCVIFGNDPAWFCRACEARWNEDGTVWKDE